MLYFDRNKSCRFPPCSNNGLVASRKRSWLYVQVVVLSGRSGVVELSRKCPKLLYAGLYSSGAGLRGWVRVQTRRYFKIKVSPSWFCFLNLTSAIVTGRKSRRKLRLPHRGTSPGNHTWKKYAQVSHPQIENTFDKRGPFRWKGV